ncbi:MAG: hypothetical protein NC336_01490 [Clostridium sp.]|nr:hypothetical protein [Clostridium sp.]
MKFLRRIILTATAMATLIPAAATVSNEPDSLAKYASNYYAYPYPENPLPPLTPSPDGYRPFHIEHYGRHGSRWHIGKQMYTRPVELLEVGERNGKLTPRGQEILGQLRQTEVKSRGRDGELTAKGARQHRGIARRMMANFPEIFVDSIFINARSTPVVRCILSMNNELLEMAAANPTFRIDLDATYADLNVLNPTDTLTKRLGGKAWHAGFNAYEKAHPYDYDFLDKLFTDRQFVNDSIDRGALLYHLFAIDANSQSHDDQPSFHDIFTPREIRQKWEHENLNWFLADGNTVASDNGAPFSQRRLLRSFITSADTAIASPTQSATLRFGHEVVVLPATVLMELGDYGREIKDPETVAALWHNYEIFPMASNIQLVFYRNLSDPSAPVLVKALLNEKEVTLPAGHVGGPYYDWNELKTYWSRKLDDFNRKYNLND